MLSSMLAVVVVGLVELVGEVVAAAGLYFAWIASATAAALVSPGLVLTQMVSLDVW